MKELLKGWNTIPNWLSYIRIALIPVFAVLFYKGYVGWAMLVLGFSGLSDFLDGKIARKFNQVSDLGKIIDPVADKLTQITIAIMFYIEFRTSSEELIKTFSWVFLIFVVRHGIFRRTYAGYGAQTRRGRNIRQSRHNGFLSGYDCHCHVRPRYRLP